MVTTRYSVLPLQWLLRLLSLLLYINLDALRILLSPLCLSYQYNQYVLLISLTLVFTTPYSPAITLCIA